MAELTPESQRIRDDVLATLTIAQFCEVIADCFGIDPNAGYGQIVEMHWDERGRFRGAVNRTGKIGVDALRRMGRFAA